MSQKTSLSNLSAVNLEDIWTKFKTILGKHSTNTAWLPIVSIFFLTIYIAWSLTNASRHYLFICFLFYFFVFFFFFFLMWVMLFWYLPKCWCLAGLIASVLPVSLESMMREVGIRRLILLLPWLRAIPASKKIQC